MVLLWYLHFFMRHTKKISTVMQNNRKRNEKQININIYIQNNIVFSEIRYFHSEFVSEICRLMNDAVQYVAHRIKSKAYRLVKVGDNFYWTTNSNTRFPQLFHYSLQIHIIWWSKRRKIRVLDSFNVQLDSFSYLYYATNWRAFVYLSAWKMICFYKRPKALGRS